MLENLWRCKESFPSGPTHVRKHVPSTVRFLATLQAVPWAKFRSIYLVSELGLSGAQVGVIRSVSLVLKSVSWLFVASVADRSRLGLRWLFIISLIASTSILVVFQLLQGWAVRTASGFALAMFLCLVRSVLNAQSPLLESLSLSLVAKAGLGGRGDDEDGNVKGTGQLPSDFRTNGEARSKAKKTSYSGQRMFGSLAWGAGSLFIGKLSDATSLSFALFTSSYVMVAGLVVYLLGAVPRSLHARDATAPGDVDSSYSSLPSNSNSRGDLASIIGHHHHDETPASSSSSPTGATVDSLWAAAREHASLCSKLAARPGTFAFLVNVFLYSLCFHAFEGILYLQMEKEWGSTRAALGLYTFVTTWVGVAVFAVGDSLIRRFGSVAMITVAETTAVVRLLLHSCVTKEWQHVTIFINLLHGLCFALFWAAAVETIQRLAPRGLEASSQSLFIMIWGTLGQAGGSLLWGIVFDRAGARPVFLAAAAILTATVMLTLPGLSAVLRKGRGSDSIAGGDSNRKGKGELVV